MRHSRHHRCSALQRSLADARSGEVVFVSHCLLNQNTRYLGGAGCPGVVNEAIADFLEDGTGIVQTPCPEQRVWGGVLKKRLLWLIQHPRIAGLLPPLLPALRGYLRWRYARLARVVAGDLEDYLDSGLAVRGIISVAGSPSCGLNTTLDLRCAVRALARRTGPVTTEWLNSTIIGPAIQPGRGLFIQQLARIIGHRQIRVPLLEKAITIGPPGHQPAELGSSLRAGNCNGPNGPGLALPGRGAAVGDPRGRRTGQLAGAEHYTAGRHGRRRVRLGLLAPGRFRVEHRPVAAGRKRLIERSAGCRSA